MPKPRKPLRLTYNPPTKRGWYAYSHVGGEFEAVYLTERELDDAQSRFYLCTALDIAYADVWSTRKLKKRERVKEHE